MEQNNNQQNAKQTFNSNPSEEYEEISEKKTSKLGYILLIMMAVFMVGVGQTIFSDLKKIPERPNSPSYCMSSFKNSGYLKSLSYAQNCSFTGIDQKFNLDSQYNNILSEINQIISLNKQISSSANSISATESEINKLNKDYDLSLQEKIANEQAIIDKSNIKSNIIQKRSEISNLNQQNLLLENQRDKIIAQINPQISVLIKSYDEAQEYYKDKHAYYKFKVFFLMLLFVLPFFVLSIYFYLKLKRKNSPYTIIFTAIAGSFSILFLQIVLAFLYDILPKEWLARIFKFFMEVPFLRYIIYYSVVILVIGLFGGLVYFIQKKIFNLARVAVRRLKDNKCPGCSFTLNIDHNFCPKCGQQIKEKCVNCNNLKIRYLTHCPYCGNK
ncbi:MAG: zinc ribbon domain-containing protein [Candidatus Jacksonbacteria bacterium]